MERLQRQQEKGREEEDELLQEVERLQEQLNRVRAAIREREKAITCVDEELRDLLRRAIAEGEHQDAPPAATGADPHAAWNLVNETLATMAQQPGVPQGWAAQFGGESLEQVRAAAVAIQLQANGQAQAGGAAAGLPQPPQAAAPAPLAASPTAAATNAAPPTPPSATPSTSSTSNAAAAAAPPAAASASRWASRVHDLVFAESGIGDGGEGRPAVAASSPGDPAALGAAAAVGGASGASGMATSPGAAGPNAERPLGAEAAAIGEGDTDLDSLASEDDMDSVKGTEFDQREDETAQQHKLRLARHLKERAKRRREAKLREREREARADKKKKESTEARSAARDRVSQKKK